MARRSQTVGFFRGSFVLDGSYPQTRTAGVQIYSCLQQRKRSLRDAGRSLSEIECVQS